MNLKLTFDVFSSTVFMFTMKDMRGCVLALLKPHHTAAQTALSLSLSLYSSVGSTCFLHSRIPTPESPLLFNGITAPVVSVYMLDLGDVCTFGFPFPGGQVA